MASKLHVLVVVSLLGLLQGAFAAQIAFVDGGQPGFVSSSATGSVGAQDVSGVLSALLGIKPSQSTSHQIEKVLAGDVFHKPAAVLALQIIGSASAGDIIRQAKLQPATSQPLELDADASGLLGAVSAVASSDLKSFMYKTVDHIGLPETCGEPCQEKLVREMVRAHGLNYTARPQPAMECADGPWCATVTTADEQMQLLDMGLKPDRLWALELAILRKTAIDAAAAFDGTPGRPQLLEATLVGLQALEAKYGAESKQAQAGRALLGGVLSEVWAAVKTAADGAAVLQLTSAEGQSGLTGIDQTLMWRAQYRQVFQRRLLQQSGDYVSSSLGAVSFQWATSSVAWLMSIILLLLVISAAICLCKMEFQEDSLLYARPKVD